MSTINITNARANLYQLVSDVNVGFNPITIVNNKGKNAVLISEDEWNSIEETLYLSSIPGLVNNINDIRKIYSIFKILFISGRKLSPQISSCSIRGISVFPNSVIAYSEWGGSSMNIFLLIMPCISNSFSC